MIKYWKTFDMVN